MSLFVTCDVCVGLGSCVFDFWDSCGFDMVVSGYLVLGVYGGLCVCWGSCCLWISVF